MSSSVGVFGAGGQAGYLLCVELIRRGHDVTGFVRSPEAVERLRRVGVSPVVADITRDDLADGLADVDSVVFSAGAGSGSGATAKLHVDLNGAMRTVDASVVAGVGRFLMVSSMWAGNPDAGPVRLRPYLVAKGGADLYLSGSSIRSVIVRPATLLDGPGTGQIAVPANDVTSTLTRSDLVQVMAELVEADLSSDLQVRVTAGDMMIRQAVEMLVCSNGDRDEES